MKVRLTKIDVDRWASGPYLVRRQEFGDVLRYIVTGPGISQGASYGYGNDMTTLAAVREVIAEAIERSVR